ncbi:hypothetical protein OG689_05075 [Kitasatospora sp. NBC_00240]|uniref:hypothetical protein n=1 Tax=Kitasatospora sp. NBC_00240 TaxID=2903567 RepID=UPI00225469CF|nr:hypothetical protein [Kitasatospora sp. NBC_00240]MCX5208670.1 hypothetical protein [Kitasatospora sp. NBC_00240]
MPAHPSLPSTRSAVSAVEALAARYGRAVHTVHDIGRDRTFAGLADPQPATDDLSGAEVRRRTFPPSCTLVVAVPGEAEYREAVGAADLTPRLAELVR